MYGMAAALLHVSSDVYDIPMAGHNPQASQSHVKVLDSSCLGCYTQRVIVLISQYVVAFHCTETAPGFACSCRRGWEAGLGLLDIMCLASLMISL